MIFEQVATTGSTNADLLQRADEGAAEGLWLRADQQEGGRGRLGRAWVSPPGNLYASTIIRLRDADPDPSGLSFVAGLAAYSALAEIAPQTAFKLKWPNDILVDGAKLCGILLERGGDAVVAGFGINLAFCPQGLGRPVTSLAKLGLAPPQPQVLAEKIAHHLARWLGIWRMGGLPPILKQWRQHAFADGTAMSATLPDGKSLAGEYAGVDENGALRLRLADGSIHAMHAGDIFLEESGDERCC